jgi:hypothetical protein
MVLQDRETCGPHACPLAVAGALAQSRDKIAMKKAKLAERTSLAYIPQSGASLTPISNGCHEQPGSSRTP